MGLAGPRIKQRISADPRNLAWSNDQTKFGYKMLSKMGWSPGKGLGINEDGEKEHIKLSVKHDNLGIGATKKTIDNWLDNTSAFDVLLKGLNDKIQTEEKEKQEEYESDGKGKGNDKTKIDKVKSKEKKKKKKENKNKDKKSIFNLQSSSNNNDSTANTSDSGSLSSNRLAHRAKFLKSKKAAIQNSDRLNEIFGVKSNKNSIDDSNTGNISITKNTIMDSSSDNDESNMKDSKEKIRKIDIITKVNEMSTHEYFTQKMKGLKITGIASTSLVSYNNNTNDDIDERPSFSMGMGQSFMNIEQDPNISNISSKGLEFVSYDNSKSTSINKKRKINDNMDINLINDNKNNSSDDKSIMRKKKEKKKNKSKKDSKRYSDGGNSTKKCKNGKEKYDKKKKIRVDSS